MACLNKRNIEEVLDFLQQHAGIKDYEIGTAQYAILSLTCEGLMWQLGSKSVVDTDSIRGEMLNKAYQEQGLRIVQKHYTRLRQASIHQEDNFVIVPEAELEAVKNKLGVKLSAFLEEKFPPQQVIR